MKKNIKEFLIISLSLSIIGFIGVLSSCAKWTEPQAKDFYTPPTQAYKNNLKDYFNSPHKVMFGWFGNWTGKGGPDRSSALMGLPDSVDFVSLWLKLGDLTPEQQIDLKEFKARGSKAVYCYTPHDIGKFATPEGKDPAKFWGYDSGKEEDFLKASVKYAMAIVDSCKKYGVDGFDIDLEGEGSLINRREPARLDTFMRTLRKEFDKFENGGLLVADIPAGWNSFYTILSDKVIEDLDYIIWQSYEIADRPSNLDGMFLALKPLKTKPGLWEKVVKKSILTGTFERAIDKPRFNALPYYHPSFGIEHAGIGAYHIEYDFAGKPDYTMVRKANAVQNPPINE